LIFQNSFIEEKTIFINAPSLKFNEIFIKKPLVLAIYKILFEF